MPDSTREWDAVVVGTGPAGATAADVLTAAGWSVLMLEKGRNHLLALDAPFGPLGHVSNDELKFMRHWLEVRGADVPGEHAHHMPGAPLMPGMLTPPEMDRLAAAKGPEFDRLFLEGMIKHHGGALTMVRELFATKGAAQEAEIFGFASDVDADQRMEIARMSAMLKELQK